ncbi:MAG: hypothetical protein ABIJ34_08255 [archaeon]
MEQEDFLKENISEFMRQAERSSKEEDYNPAATLFFKAIVVTVDYIILKKEGYIPNNHNDRFLILKNKYPHLYDILDKDFPLYQKTSSLRSTKEQVRILEKDAKRIIEESGIEKDN